MASCLVDLQFLNGFEESWEESASSKESPTWPNRYKWSDQRLFAEHEGSSRIECCRGLPPWKRVCLSVLASCCGIFLSVMVQSFLSSPVVISPLFAGLWNRSRGYMRSRQVKYMERFVGHVLLQVCVKSLRCSLQVTSIARIILLSEAFSHVGHEPVRKNS